MADSRHWPINRPLLAILTEISLLQKPHIDSICKFGSTLKCRNTLFLNFNSLTKSTFCSSRFIHFRTIKHFYNLVFAKEFATFESLWSENWLFSHVVSLSEGLVDFCSTVNLKEPGNISKCYEAV